MIGSGFHIGRLYGINIQVDWSWMLIAGLVVWNLRGVFGQIHPEWGSLVQWALALLAALLFFASVIAHELAHSIVARSEGLPVHSITLFLFGGVASIQREPPSPRAEFLIAIAGPAISLLIGGLLLMVGIGGAAMNQGMDAPLRMIAELSPPATLLVWLGSINLILAIFNLIPGFPLDGGRVLRSLLWAITRSLRHATRLASWIGRFIAWGMMAMGLAMLVGIQIPFLGGGLINGLWTIFVGWFLNNAAAQSYQQVVIQDDLGAVSVAQLMSRSPATIGPAGMLGDLIVLHTLGNGSANKEPLALPVVENGRLLGIVTPSDVRRVPKETWRHVSVRDAMTPAVQLVTVSPEENAAGALEKLLQCEVMQVPVVGTDERYLGLLHRQDIARWLQRKTKRV